MAKESGIRQGTISNLELGKRENPQTDTLQRICDALGVSLAEFDNSTDDFNTMVLEELDKMKLGRDGKAARERIKKMPPDELQRQIEDIVKKYKSLSVKNQEAIAVIIDSLSSSQK